MLSSRQIDPADFREMKSDYSNKLERLEAKLSAFNHEQIDIKQLLDKGLDNLLKLDTLMKVAT